jgi:hypothetical protein
VKERAAAGMEALVRNVDTVAQTMTRPSWVAARTASATPLTVLATSLDVLTVRLRGPRGQREHEEGTWRDLKDRLLEEQGEIELITVLRAKPVVRIDRATHDDSESHGGDNDDDDEEKEFWISSMSSP